MAQPVFDLYGKNLAVFTTANVVRSEVVAFTLLVVFGPPLFAAAILVGAMAIGSAVATRTFQVIVGVFATALALNVLRLLGVSQWLVTSVLALGVGAFSAWGVHKSRGAQNWLAAVSVLAPALIVIFLSQTSAVFSSGAITIQSPRDVPGDILFLITDEAPLFPLIGADGLIDAARFPGYGELAKSATWYRNATTHSQSTTDAVPALLTGVNVIPGTDPTLRAHPNSLFTLVGGSMRVRAEELTTNICPKDLCAPDENENGFRRGRLKAFTTDAATVYGHRVLPENLRSKLPDIGNGWGNFGGDNPTEEALLDAQLDKAGRSARISNLKTNGQISQVQVLRNLGKQLISGKEPGLYFAHLMLPHRSWSLTPELRRHEISHPGNADTPADVGGALRDYQQLLMQYTALDGELLRLIDKLKSAGKWDNLTLIISADHGLTLEPGLSKRKVIDFTNNDQVDDVFRIPLFVKYPGQLSGKLDDCPVTTIDVLPTIAEVINEKPLWSIDGKSFRRSCPNSSPHGISSPLATGTFTNSLSKLFERARRYDNIVSREGGASGIFATPNVASFVANAPKIIGGTSALVASWTVDQLDLFNDIQVGLGVSVPALVTGSITLSGGVPKDAVGIITIDGRGAGVIPELNSASAGKMKFEAFVNTSLLTAGAHKIGLLISVGGATGELLAAPVPRAS